MLRAAMILGVSLVSLVSVEAWAGGCVGCTSHADCSNGVCVRWTTNPGCGTMNQTCCPGQTPNTGSCSGGSGRASCEDAGTCTVLGGAAGGSGTAGGGSSGTAGGSAGGGTMPSGGCSAAPGAVPLAVALAGVLRRRRR